MNNAARNMNTGDYTPMSLTDDRVYALKRNSGHVEEQNIKECLSDVRFSPKGALLSLLTMLGVIAYIVVYAVIV